MSPTDKRTRHRQPQHRKLRMEQLEDRRMLAITVDTLTDVVDATDGLTSLREAVAEAPDGETIVFSVSGTSNLLQELVIDKNLTITGPGAEQLTLDAGHGADSVSSTGDGYRVFRIDDGVASTNLMVTIRGLSITGGDVGPNDDGGAVLSRESVTLESVDLHANSAGRDAGGVFNEGGALSIVSSRVADNFAANNGGGVVTVGGELLLTSSTVSGNTAGRNGGGVYSAASDASLTASTISGNIASSSGGGVFTVDSTISNSLEHETRIVNSTLSGNHANARYFSDAGGGIHVFTGLATILHSTITNNSVTAGATSSNSTAAGGISSGVFLTRTDIFSTIIAGNTGGRDVASGTVSSFQSNGYNVVGFGNAASSFHQPGDQRKVLDPLLGPLQDNGGPTLTHLPLITSPVIDQGDPTAASGVAGVPAFDQRGDGFDRVETGRIDVGAVEFRFATPMQLVVDTTLDELDFDYGPGDLSLREAIGLANITLGVDTITFAPTLSG